MAAAFIKCPGCATPLPRPDHTEPFFCPTCGKKLRLLPRRQSATPPPAAAPTAPAEPAAPSPETAERNPPHTHHDHWMLVAIFAAGCVAGALAMRLVFGAGDTDGPGYGAMSPVGDPPYAAQATILPATEPVPLEWTLDELREKLTEAKKARAHSDLQVADLRAYLSARDAALKLSDKTLSETLAKLKAAEAACLRAETALAALKAEKIEVDRPSPVPMLAEAQPAAPAAPAAPDPRPAEPPPDVAVNPVAPDPSAPRTTARKTSVPAADKGAGKGKVLTLNQSSFAKTIEKGVTLVDFWAPWCGPCRAQAPVIDALAADMKGKASIAKVNIDDNPKIAAQHRISAIPALIVFKDGKEVERLIGIRPQTVLADAVRKHL